jgi:hypothetical protein
MNDQQASKPIEIPLWMDVAITGLAEKHQLSVAEEIAFLTEQAINRYFEGNESDGQARIALESGMVFRNEA